MFLRPHGYSSVCDRPKPFIFFFFPVYPALFRLSCLFSLCVFFLVFFVLDVVCPLSVLALLMMYVYGRGHFWGVFPFSFEWIRELYCCCTAFWLPPLPSPHIGQRCGWERGGYGRLIFCDESNFPLLGKPTAESESDEEPNILVVSLTDLVTL